MIRNLNPGRDLRTGKLKQLPPGSVAAPGAAGRIILSLALTLLVVAPLPVTAQRAAPLLAPDHWVYSALSRVDALSGAGLSFDGGANTLSAIEAAARLRAHTESTDPARRAMAAAYWQLLELEFSGLQRSTATRVLQIAPGLGALAEEGVAAPGSGFIRGEDFTGARELPDRSGLVGEFHASALTSRAALQLSLSYHDTDVSLRGTHAVAALGNVNLWAGNRRLRFGNENGFVLSGAIDVSGGGLFLNEPVRLPWIFRHLGPFRFELFLSQMDSSGIVQDPFFWGARGSIQPTRNLILGLNRAAIFGGDGNSGSLLDFLEMLVGGYGGELGEFENQVVSADFRWVLPSDQQSIELYGEWAADDGSGMWHLAPALRAGIALPALAGWRHGFASVEGAYMGAKPANYNTYWYRNVYFRGSWAKDDVLLGHPLGGHGREIRLSLGSDLGLGKLQLRASGFARERGDENTWSPERAGNSLGVTTMINARWRALDLSLRGEFEKAGGWKSNQLRLLARTYF